MKNINAYDIKKFFAYLLSDKDYNPSSVALARSALSFFYDEMLGKKSVVGVKPPNFTLKSLEKN